LADEPTGELDTATGRQIMFLFQKISIEEGVTVLMVTHDPVIEEYASLVYHLGDGTIEDITEHPENRTQSM
jgi:ABC-type lipoprotein export system ATPase subunit